jgi:hypothetical protein
LGAVVANLGHLVCHDPMTVDIDGGLNVVADNPGPLTARRIDRESGSVSEICWSGSARTCASSSLKDYISALSTAIFSFSLTAFACATSPSCRSVAS